MEIVDDGYVAVKVTDADGKVHEATLDLYEADCAISDAIRAARRKAGADEDLAARLWYGNLVEVFKERGLPPLSFGAVLRLVRQIRQAVDDFKKKHPELDSPASPASTGSTPGN